MSGHGFTSAFAAQLDAYLEFKQSMGFYGASRIWYLQQFDAWCAGRGRTVFDQATVEEWVAARLESSGRYRSWMSYIRDFGRWLQATGHPGAYVVGPVESRVRSAAPLPAGPAGDRRVLHRGGGAGHQLAVAMAGSGVLHAHALMRAADR